MALSANSSSQYALGNSSESPQCGESLTLAQDNEAIRVLGMDCELKADRHVILLTKGVVALIHESHDLSPRRPNQERLRLDVDWNPQPFVEVGPRIGGKVTCRQGQVLDCRLWDS